MPNEFDEIAEASPAATAVDTTARAATPASRLVARLFAAAGNPLRARLLQCLMRPLSLLGAAGVASGAFIAFFDRHGSDELRIDAEALARVSSQQMLELARFVEQVEPQALEQFAQLAANSPLAVATFSASVLLLLVRRLPSATRDFRPGA